MFSHISLRVRDLPASVRFYQAFLAPLGYGVAHQDDESAGFGPPDQPMFWLTLGGAPSANAHLAFAAADDATVDRAYAAGLAAGGRDNGKPELIPDYGPTYYGGFLFDPDGNNVEAVHS
ncbi:MAG TPA: VOC family protein [Candidatus Sulfotelmatobacter sp.]|nr:VOC family protein [Candidatus Sulfotelmatobacter sp.]